MSPVIAGPVPLLTLEEVARRLDITREQVLELAETGPLVAIAGKGDPHITEIDLNTFLAHHLPTIEQLRAVA